MQTKERKKLGALVVEAGLATPLQIDHALQSQHVFGGSLGTNLVEMGIVDSHGLAAFLSKQYGVPEATARELNQIPNEVVKLIPKAAAEKLCLLPLHREGESLVVAMMDPSDERLIARVEENLKIKLVCKIASELEIRKGLKVHYDIPLSARLLHLLSQDEVVGEVDGEVIDENTILERHLDKIISTSEAIQYYFDEIGSLNKIPVVDFVGDITQRQLSTEMIFLFQQVDGITTIQEIISMNVFSKLSTLRTMVYFAKEGMIQFIGIA